MADGKGCNFDCAEKQWQRSPAGDVLPKRLHKHAQHALPKALDIEVQPKGVRLRRLGFPGEDSQPPLDVASRADEEVLQFNFPETPVTAAAHAVLTGQFTQGAFDRVAPVHPLLEGFATLFLATLLQKFMVLTHNEGATLLAGRHAIVSQRAALAGALPPLKTVEDLDAVHLLAHLQSAAVAAGMTGRAARPSLRDTHVEVFDRQAFTLWGRPFRRGLLVRKAGKRSPGSFD